MMEGCIRDVWFRVLGHTLGEIPQLTFHEAMRRYGSDKPDLRFGSNSSTSRNSSAQRFSALSHACRNRGQPGDRAALSGGASLSRRDFDALTEVAKSHGAKGLAYITLAADGVKGPIVKFLGDSTVAALRAETMSENGDAILFIGERAREASELAAKCAWKSASASVCAIRRRLHSAGCAASRSSRRTRKAARSHSRTIRSRRPHPAKKHSSRAIRSGSRAALRFGAQRVRTRQRFDP